MWPDRRFLDLLGIELPIVQAPMASAVTSELVIAVSEAGGLGSLACAMMAPEQARTELGIVRQRTARPISVNFFCHEPPRRSAEREARWIERLKPYYAELGLDPAAQASGPGRTPFDEAMCEVMVEFAPEVVSFHFGLPDLPLVQRLKAAGCKVIASATSAAEARFLDAEGCDAV